MKKIRIGKDINVRWEITLPEGIDTLDGLNLSLDMRDPKGNKVKINEFELEGDNVVLFGLRGTAFVFIGNYSFTLWVNKGELGQTLVDCINAFQLVTSTDKENDEEGCGCGVLEVSTIDIYGDLTFPVVRGPKGDPGAPGEPGPKGDDGTSVIVKSITKVDKTTTVVLEDVNGEYILTINDGEGADLTEGEGININNGEVSVDTTVIATRAYVQSIVGDINDILSNI